MPRYQLNAKPLKLQEKQRRSKDFRVRGLVRWIDPFPTVHGTLPEKMVYEALSRRAIRFYFLGNVTINIPELEIFKKYQADFILPDQRIIIEVQGAYWHSKPAAIESDALKHALYEQMGYKVLAWWDFDIIYNINNLFAQEPMLSVYNVTDTASSELAPVDRTKIDTSGGIRTRNKKRGNQLLYRKSSVKIKQTTKLKSYGGYKNYGK